MWLPKQAKQLTSILANRQARAGQRPARAQPMAERLSVADLRRRKQNGFFDQALVATRDAGERCARPEARRLQTSRSKKIAASLKRSAEHSSRRKANPYRSALSMLTFYINRAGKTLPGTQRKRLERAKAELKHLFHREA